MGVITEEKRTVNHLLPLLEGKYKAGLKATVFKVPNVINTINVGCVWN